VLAKGTVVDLQLDDPISTRSSKIGDTFRLHLAEPIRAGEAVLVPAGAAGMGEVIHVAKAGMSGSPGELIVAARFVQYGDVRLPLGRFRWGSSADAAAPADATRGKSNQTAAIAFGVAGLGLFISGGNIDIPRSAAAHASLSADVALAGQSSTSPGAP
jgi:hypothetical protein